MSSNRWLALVAVATLPLMVTLVTATRDDTGGTNATHRGRDSYIRRFQADCGVRFRNTKGQQERVGRLVQPGEWSWTVALTREGDHLHCMGSLITDRHVLTAAHCVTGGDISKIRVRAGHTDLTKANFSDDTEIQQFNIHPSYVSDKFFADIAILELRKALPLNERISVCCLPDYQDHTGRIGYVTKWVTETSTGVVLSRYLLGSELLIWSNSKCAAARQRPISPTIVCAGRRNTCTGISGSPLMVENTATKRWSLHGILIFGTGPCGRVNEPDGFTRVAPFTRWIIETVDQ